jgi:hypothetical protein
MAGDRTRGPHPQVVFEFDVPPNGSAVAEVYPALCSRTFPSDGLTPAALKAAALRLNLKAGSCSAEQKPKGRLTSVFGVRFRAGRRALGYKGRVPRERTIL